MRLDLCVAQAINSDLDIVEALPIVTEMPIEKIEPNVRLFVQEIQGELCRAIRLGGEECLQRGDAAGLCVTCLEAGVSLPPHMLLKMCETIVALYPTKVSILNTARGPIYLVQMTV